MSSIQEFMMFLFFLPLMTAPLEGLVGQDGEVCVLPDLDGVGVGFGIGEAP